MQAVLTVLKSRFHPSQFLWLLFSILLMEGIFSWIFIQNSIVIESYTKLLSLLIYGFMLYKYPALQKDEKNYVLLFSLLMLKLVLESLIEYESFLKKHNMFTVLFPVIYVVFVKYLCRSLQMDLLPFIARFYLVSYIVFMLLFGRGFSFSLDQIEMDDYGPYSGDGRIMHASHVFMMIVPFLWYLHQYVDSRRSKYLWPLLFCIVIIVVHQHRSVWSSTMVALFIYMIAAMRNCLIKAGKVVKITLSAILIAAFCGFVVSNLMPGFGDFLAERFGEIFNPAKEGSTGNFRLEQREVYGGLFLQRPIFGWTVEGFEMPNPLVDWWPPMTGQHFHEGYMEMLFYHGIVGLLLKYAVLLYFLYKTFSKRLSAPVIILMAFCISGLVFSLNYVLPLVFWAIVGICLYYMDLNRISFYKHPKTVNE